jgi:hypothetical protein
MSYYGEPYRGTSYPMPSHLEQAPGIVVAQYDFIGVKAADWDIERISLGGYTESDFIELVTFEQHDIVEANLRQRLNGMPAPMSSGGLRWPGTAHVFFNNWEAKYEWDVAYCHNIHESHFGELLQINRDMESDGFEGVSLAQGHQGERTYRDPQQSRWAETNSGISFTSAKDDDGHCFIKFNCQFFPRNDPNFQEWSAWAKKRQDDKQAKLSRAEIVRLHEEVNAGWYEGYRDDSDYSDGYNFDEIYHDWSEDS